MKFSEKKILITGASSGIGKAVALKVAEDGAEVILAARSKDKLEKLAEEISLLGGKPKIVVTDVTKDEDVKNLFLAATEDGKPLDGVFNNAGLGFIGNIYELTTDQIHKIIDVNVAGMIIVAKYAAEVMTRQKSGHIIMTSSLAGLVTLPQWSVYVASKWAITGFADCIRPELKPFNIQVTTIHPGGVKTEFFEKEKADIDISNLGGDVISAEDVANQVYDVFFTNRKRVVLPGSSKAFAFIKRIAPSLSDGLVERMASKIKYHESVAEDEPDFDK